MRYQHLVEYVIKNTYHIIKQGVRNNGYCKVSLYHKFKKKKTFTISVHKMVLITFIGLPEDINKNQINHKNGNKLDNNLYNLEWVTQSENQKHAIEIGLQPSGEDRVNSIYTNDFIKYICILLHEGYRTKDIIYNITKKNNIEKCRLKNLIADIKGKKSWYFISKDYQINKNGIYILENRIQQLFINGFNTKEIKNVLCDIYNYKPMSNTYITEITSKLKITD
jgi:hypothetical protein